MSSVNSFASSAVQLAADIKDPEEEGTDNNINMEILPGANDNNGKEEKVNLHNC